MIYEGPARMHTAVGGAELEVGDERTVFSTATASIDSGKGIPQSDDLLEVLVTPQSTQTHLAGRVFAVGSVQVGGHFDVGYVLALSAWRPAGGRERHLERSDAQRFRMAARTPPDSRTLQAPVRRWHEVWWPGRSRAASSPG